MLTRLKINGFKNLVDVDVRFGAFTCIAGTNGVGKSNLFDAIRFLSALADQPLMEAARSVRGGKTADIKSLFRRVGEQYYPKMSFQAEMIIPDTAADDLGQEAKASVRFVRYTLELGLREDDATLSSSGLEILKEELIHIRKGDAHHHLLFPHSKEWRGSLLSGSQSTSFISTEDDPASGRVVVKLHQNRSGSESGGGRAAVRLASTLPRTVLSVSNAAENRTALCTRREMQSWRLLQLEPTALREPNEFTATPRLGSDGSHLAATLYRLAHRDQETGNADEAKVYAQIANRLSDLIDDVHEVSVDRDARRELLTLYVAGKDKTPHPARALSDGTLRFLALATIDLDPAAQGLLCLEEPENGIHPERIPAMLRLLQDIAVDTSLPVEPDNPLRQVIVNTHSPAVVSQVDDDSLLVAVSEQDIEEGRAFQKTVFGCLPETWREASPYLSDKPVVVPKGKLLSYLNPLASAEKPTSGSNSSDSSNGDGKNHEPKSKSKSGRKPVRVMDREDFQLMLFAPEN